jgi:hypothetical protein
MKMFNLQINDDELSKKLETQINQCFQHVIGDELQSWTKARCKEIVKERVLEALSEIPLERLVKDEVQNVLKEFRSGKIKTSLVFG